MAVAADRTEVSVGPGLDEVHRLARDHTLVPLRHTFVDDCETPVAAYLKLRGGGPSFLLESAEQGRRFGRWSFLGVRPRRVIRLEDGELRIADRRDGAGIVAESPAGRDPFAAVAHELRRYRLALLPDLPPFAGGAVGLFGYDLARISEPAIGTAPPDELRLPDLALMVSDVLVAFDHLRHEVTILANVFVEGDLEARYAEAAAAIADVRERLAAPVPRARTGKREVPEYTSNQGADGYARAVERVKELHSSRRLLSGRSEPALECRLPGGGVLDLPRPPDRQPEPVHVLPRFRGLPDRRRLAGVARQGHRSPCGAAPDRRHSAARRRRHARTWSGRRSCSRTRRSAPST